MCIDPTSPAVGGGYYVIDRLADPREIVTVIACAPLVVVRDARGVEYPVAPGSLSTVPPDDLYRRLRAGADHRCP